MAQGPTQPLTEMSTRNISWGKGGRCVGLTTFQVPIALKSGTLKLLEPPGPVKACNGIVLPFRVQFINHLIWILCSPWLHTCVDLHSSKF
jgi:hypothetical protein